MIDHAIPSRAITVRQWLDLGRLVTHNARVHQMRRETDERRSLAESDRNYQQVFRPVDNRAAFDRAERDKIK